MLKKLFDIYSRGRLTVLLFHRVPVTADPLEPDALTLAGFEKILDRLSHLFHILPLAEALAGLRAGNLPPSAACITFDDGYPDWMKGVVPVLERRQIHATFFITTGQFHGMPLWTERLRHAVGHATASTRPLSLSSPGLEQLALNTLPARLASLAALDRHLKYLLPQERDEWIRRVESHCDVQAADTPVMSVQDLRTLHGKGFGIGGHSISHPILARCDEALAMEEIGGSREQLEALVGGGVTTFAYPNGIPVDDFGPEHLAMVRRAGYTSAMTTHWGAASSDTSMFQLPRFTPWGPGWLKMQLQMARNLRHRSRAIPEQDTAHRRALMVAFHFPPQAGSSGILRTLNFVKHLPQHGWQPQVLTATAHAYVEQRNDLVASIPPQTPIVRGFALDAARHLSLAGKYPRLFALPDRWSTWWLGGVLAGWKAIRQHRPHLIWSTYPISTAHWIGATLSALTRLPWVADFRDPMVSPGYPVEPLQRKAWERLEARVLRCAALCVFTTERAAKNYIQRYPDARDRCTVIENGYDEGAFENVAPDRGGVPQDALLMLHSGLIYPGDRNPSGLFRALKELVEEGELHPDKVRVRFRAPHHADEVLAFARDCGVAHMVEVAPPLPYRQAIAEMLGADVLLLFQGSNFNAQVPAKVYEYLRAQRQVLGAVDPAGDTASLLSGYENVEVAHIDEMPALKASLRRSIGRLTDPMSHAGFEANRVKVLRYSRAMQARLLASHLDRLV